MLHVFSLFFFFFLNKKQFSKIVNKEAQNFIFLGCVWFLKTCGVGGKEIK